MIAMSGWTLLLTIGLVERIASADGVCQSWCNSWTCGMAACEGCDVCAARSDGTLCSSWCNSWTCSFDHCNGCGVCSASHPEHECKSWCNVWTCGLSTCTNCTTCEALRNGTYCASWCNDYTDSLAKCDGCPRFNAAINTSTPGATTSPYWREHWDPSRVTGTRPTITLNASHLQFKLSNYSVFGPGGIAPMGPSFETTVESASNCVCLYCNSLECTTANGREGCLYCGPPVDSCPADSSDEQNSWVYNECASWQAEWYNEDYGGQTQCHCNGASNSLVKMGFANQWDGTIVAGLGSDCDCNTCDGGTCDSCAFCSESTDDCTGTSAATTSSGCMSPQAYPFGWCDCTSGRLARAPSPPWYDELAQDLSNFWNDIKCDLCEDIAKILGVVITVLLEDDDGIGEVEAAFAAAGNALQGNALAEAANEIAAIPANLISTIDANFDEAKLQACIKGIVIATWQTFVTSLGQMLLSQLFATLAAGICDCPTMFENCADVLN